MRVLKVRHEFNMRGTRNERIALLPETVLVQLSEPFYERSQTDSWDRHRFFVLTHDGKFGTVAAGFVEDNYLAER